MDVELAGAEDVPGADADHAPVLREQRDRFDVIRQRGAELACRDRVREREPIGFGHEVVVEDGGARQPSTLETRKLLGRATAAKHSPAAQLVGGDDAAVSSQRDDAIDEKAGAHRDFAADERSIERHGEGQGPDRVRGDARERPALADRLAGAREVQMLQIAEAAVNGAEVIE